MAIADGYRESTASWRDLLLDLKARALQAGPLLAALSALPKAQHGRAKTDLAQIWNASTRAEALVAFERFVATYGAKYPKAVEKLKGPQ